MSPSNVAEVPPDRDHFIGAAVTALRGEMTQQALAAAMRSKGWKWSQATVWSVEKGERPLRLGEAADLAEILGTRLDSFLKQPDWLVHDQRLTEATREIQDAYRAIAANTELMIGARRRLEQLMRTGKTYSVAAAGAIEGVEKMTPDRAVAAGRLSHEWMQTAAAQAEIYGDPIERTLDEELAEDEGGVGG